MEILRGIDQMANHDTIVSSDKLSAIADAIRDKTGKSDALTLDQMPEEIESISTGGATPQCGIVPTSWASNGLVLSANSYGDVPVAALSTITANSYTYFSSDPHNYAPESINTSQTDLPVTDEIVLNTYTYINSLSFQTVPRIIGSQAFLGCCWLELNELPEGITAIGSMAFYKCFNVCISTIPSTVTYIGDEAFYDCGLSYRTTPYYSNEATYNIGDIICNKYGSDDYYYTCVVPVTSPEEFDSNKWVSGCYPEIVGIYDSTQNYNTGDIVYDYNTATDTSGNTVLNYMNTKFSGSYSPEVTGIVQATDYVVGDVVSDADGNICTCYVNVSASEAMDLDSSHWISGCYPQILGEFDPNYNYSVGDCYVHFGYVVTCCSAGVGDSAKYINGYYPGIVLYQNTETYKVGDVVLHYNDDPARYYVYTCIADISIPEEFDNNKWLMDRYLPGISYGYDPSKLYSIGDVLYEPNMGLYTCIENNTIGISPWDESDTYDMDRHWISEYAPNILGKYSTTAAYTVGSVVAAHSGSNFYACTCIQQSHPSILLLDAYCPNLVGVYDPAHIYNPGDVVMYFWGTILDDEISYYNNLYLCISNENVSGKFDSTRWYNMSASGNCKISKLTFLGTPEYIDSGAFNDSTYDPELGYLLALVPWSSENNPQGFNESSFIAVIHDYPVQ